MTKKHAAGAGALAVFLALFVLHMLNAATLPVWAPFIPEIGRNLEVGPGTLGTALLGQPLGLIAGGLLGPVLVRLLGARPSIVVGAIGYWAPLPLVGLAGVLAAFDKPQALFFALVAVGVGNGIFDVAWGIQSTAFEAGRARRHHVGIQLAVSLGAFLGATGGAFAAGRGITVFTNLAAFSVLALVLAVPIALAVLPKLRREPQAEPAAEDDEIDRQREPTLRGGSLRGLATICLLGGFLLGAVYTWSVALLEGLGAVNGATGSGVGLIVFAVTQAVGLLTVWILPRSVRPRMLISFGGLVAAAGATVVVTSGHVQAVVIGLGVLGLGVALTWPVAQSAAAEGAPHRRAGVMSFMIVAMYLGLGLAPYAVGQLTERVGLQAAMVTLIAASVLIVVFALVSLPRKRRWQRA